MDKELATKLLGFRDAAGKLVCPADVVDPSKSYTVYLIPQKGVEPPSKDVVGRIGAAFKALGFKGSIQLEDHKGGQAFLNKKGDVVCRLVESKAAPPKKEKPPAEDVAAVAEVVAAADSVTVTTSSGKTTKKTKKKTTKKKTKK
jgi:hypothetical protein